ncbi:MAG: hypothetical protein HY650_09840 [Acidobacteria bacterium]|nr:hypothetical protein [Acidobacteriota bacterium]
MAALTPDEVDRVWQRMAEAEVRAFYFADLAARATRQKQIITGVSFFLSSGAAATVIEDAQDTLEMLLSRAREASENGIEMPLKEPLIEKWANHVYSRLSKSAAA